MDMKMLTFQHDASAATLVERVRRPSEGQTVMALTLPPWRRDRRASIIFAPHESGPYDSLQPTQVSTVHESAFRFVSKCNLWRLSTHL